MVFMVSLLGLWKIILMQPYQWYKLMAGNLEHDDIRMGINIYFGFIVNIINGNEKSHKCGFVGGCIHLLNSKYLRPFSCPLSVPEV